MGSLELPSGDHDDDKSETEARRFGLLGFVVPVAVTKVFSGTSWSIFGVRALTAVRASMSSECL